MSAPFSDPLLLPEPDESSKHSVYLYERARYTAGGERPAARVDAEPLFLEVCAAVNRGVKRELFLRSI
jgi:hypothetical protein